MPEKLPVNIADLLRQRSVEGERIEYKAGWNPDAIIRTLCAFANDFQNLGGGYVVIGQDCDANGQPVFPPVIVSVPGPDRSIKTVDFEAGRAVIRRYRNRRIGEFLKELELTEGRSTGLPKILKAMAANGSPPPQLETDDDRLACAVHLPAHPLAKRPEPGGADTGTMDVTMDVTPEVAGLLKRVQGEMSRVELQALMGLRNADHFRKAYLAPAMAAGALEMTDPTSPRSTRQRYRLTAKARQWLQQQAQEGHR